MVARKEGLKVKKKTVILIAAGALALALLLGGLPLISHLVYHRSQAATLLAWQFRKDSYTTEEAFRAYLAEKSAENARDYTLPEDAALTVSVDYSEYGGMPIYTLNGAGEPGGQVIWYFPGGSYIDEPALTHWTFLNRLSEDTGAVIVVPIYPKLPDNDAQTAYAALSRAYDEYMRGMVYGELVFMGDSAGGGMALSFAMQLRDAGLSGPDRLILLSPWVDVTMENPAIEAYEKRDPMLDAAMLAHLGEIWAGGLDETDPIVSPLYGSFEDLGEIWVFETDGELLYPDLQDLGRALDESGAAHSSYDRPNLFHRWPLYAYMNIPESQVAYEDIVSILTTGDIAA